MKSIGEEIENSKRGEKSCLLEGEKIGELVKYIINKFAKENLTRNEAIEILDRTKECTGDAAVIREVD